MNWSTDLAPTSPSLHTPSTGGEHMSLPYVLLPNKDSIKKKRAKSNNSGPSILNYSNNQLTIASS